jgi:hypothetical protein
MTKVGYQYVVLRCVPRVDREEFLNVGVVLYSQAADYLCAAGQVFPDRLHALDPGIEVAAVQGAVDAITKICCGDHTAGAAAQTSLSQRFGWIAAPKSTVLQPGPIHGGLTDDPARELEHLLETLVG